MNELDRRLQNRKKEGGFTLVELLVVIVIIGILAAVAVFAVSGIKDKGQTNACAADKRAVETAVEAYRAQQDDPSAAASIPTMTELKDGGFLHEESTLSEIDDTTGEVTGVGDCA